MLHNARVLCLDTDAELAALMRRISAEESEIRRMLPKARHYLVLLEKVSLPAARILKEIILSNGGEALVSRKAVTGGAPSSDVLLSGTRTQFVRATHALRENRHGCREIAGEVESALRHFLSAPLLPEPESVTDPKLEAMFDLVGARTLVMGILNVTPDSFSDGGRFADAEGAVECGARMVQDGADVVDIGGESTRPGAEPVPIDEEIERVVPVIRGLADSVDVPISIDTYKVPVARAALDAGALIVNDISGASFDEEMPALIAERDCPAILMHIKGTPRDMQADPTYDDLMGEVCGFLRERIEVLKAAGVDERLLMVDPGFGFGKTVAHNLEMLRRLRELRSIGRPIVVGTSRKSAIGKVLGDLPVEERLEGTAATVTLAIANGGDVVRVHDVKEMTRVARMADAVVRASEF